MKGERVGNYVITSLLGRGGMGAVYLAEHELLKRPAAIKMLLPVLSGEPESIARLFEEAKVTTSISDPGIVQIFDFGYHEDGRAYIVMEYLQGMSLDVRIDWSGALEPQRALRIARQVATALEAAHARGVIHRDLKLDNVFLVHDPAVPGGERAKILDFGIAKLDRADRTPSARTRTGAIMGTPKYMSPEQCRDSHDVDHRSDIYSLGCLLFCMVTGGPPFDYPSAAEVMSAHLKEEPPRASQIAELPPRWAAGIDAIIARCLAKDPAARFQHMADVARAIASLLDEPGDAGDDARSPTLMPARLTRTSGPTLPTRTLSPPPAVRPPLRWQLPVVLALLAGAGGAAAITGRQIINGPAAAGAEPIVLPALRSTTIPAEPARPAPSPSPPAPPPAPAPSASDPATPATLASILPPPSLPSRTPTRARSSKESHAQTSAIPELPFELAPELAPPELGQIDDDRPETVDRSD